MRSQDLDRHHQLTPSESRPGESGIPIRLQSLRRPVDPAPVIPSPDLPENPAPPQDPPIEPRPTPVGSWAARHKSTSAAWQARTIK